MNKDSISVVLAAYNGALFLKEQLESILAQSLPAFEIICLDDGSTDETSLILQSYQDRLPGKIRYCRNTENAGSRKTFEKGVRMAQGDYIAFSDQDDWWYPNKLQVLFAEITRDKNLAFAYSNAELVNEKLETVRTKTWGDEKNFLDGDCFYQVVEDNSVMGCSMLVRTEFARACLPFPSAGLHHDWYLAVMALGLGRPIRFVNRNLLKYRRHAGNQVYRERKGWSKNTRQFRALRSYREIANLDLEKFTNRTFKQLMTSKREMFRHILSRQPIRAFRRWKEYYSLLEAQCPANPRARRSNLRYIFYSLFWKRTAL